MDRYNDNELVYLTRQGCEIAFELLIFKYKTLIKKMVNHYVSHTLFNEANREDFYQTLLITFYRNIDAYREDQNTMFSTFMFVVLERRMNSYTRDYCRTYYLRDKDSISLDKPLSKNNEKTPMLVEEVVADQSYQFQPEKRLLIKERLNAIEGVIDEQASPIEKEVFYRMRQGYSPEDIANELKCPIRSVRNAFYRANRKIKVKKP